MKRQSPLLLATLVALFVSGCGSDRAADDRRPARAPGAGAPASATPGGALALPASFAGDLPCADCAGLHYQLLLRPDSIYFLRRTYRAPEVAVGARNFDEIGAWTLQDSTLVLRGGREAPDLFRVQSSALLRKLDLQGKDIESKANYALEREASPAPLEPALRLSGMYTAGADAAHFVECSTGLRLRVAGEAEHEALAQAAAEAGPQGALHASLEGRIVQRAASSGAPTEEMLVVTKFERVSPGEACPPTATPQGVAGHEWFLVATGDTPVPAGLRRAPFLHLDAQAGTVHGFAGCNSFRGPFKLEAGALSFGPLAATLMACPESATENAFLAALNATTRWQIRDGQLELVGGAGETLARLAPAPLHAGGGTP